MRLGTTRRYAPRWWRRNGKQVSGGLLLLLFISLLIGSGVYFAAAVRPSLSAVGQSRSQELATLIANRAVRDILVADSVSYSDLVTLQTDEAGRVTAIQSNVTAINRLKSDVAIRVQEEVAALQNTEITFPFGMVTGSDILAGMGPNIPVRLMPNGAVTVELNSAFAAAGINQTRHTIMLTVTVDMFLMMPTIRDNVSVVTQTPIAETVLVGSVPNSYVNIGGDADPQLKSQALEVLPGVTEEQ